MESQKRQLEAELLSNGWRVVEREAITSEWWADEIWTIEAVWRPEGFQLFLTFLVDQMQSGTRRPGEEVSSISCSALRPQTRAEATSGPLIFLRPSWEKNLPDFLTRLNEIRDRACQEPTTR